MKNLTTLDQLSTSTNTTSFNPVFVLKHSYNLDRIMEIENKAHIAVHLIQSMKKDIALKGIKETPRDEVLDDVIKMVLKKYSFLTPIEIEIALEMERYGEFEEKTEHYQFYGTEYVAEVLKKYLNWKQQKATELNLSRKTFQIEHKVDEEKINSEYLNTILTEIKKGKELSSIQAHLIYDDIPKEELPTKEDAIKLFQEQSKIVKNRFELKKTNEKDLIRIKQLTEVFTNSFEANVKIRCRNIVTCNWLIKKNNL